MKRRCETAGSGPQGQALKGKKTQLGSWGSREEKKIPASEDRGDLREWADGPLGRGA